MSADATHTSPPDPTRTAGDGTRTANPPVLDTPTVDGDHAPPVPTFDPPPGFVLDRELGRGGMGVVYLARQVGLNRPVALKLIQSGDTGSVLRFLAEAEAMAAMRHPNVAEVYQFGEHAGRPFLALEYCPGGDLTRLVSPTPVSPTRERGTDANWFRARADLMAKVADGVAAAHAVGIVHRDLKPHNVLLTANGTPKVTDFGLAKREGGSDLTKTTAVMGTPAYMPPEQAKGETKFVGPQADVWALGVMLYEALTGTRPFTGADHWAVLAAVQRGTFAPPRTVVPDLPLDLELVCLRCLKADPRDRYPTAAELASDLRNWLDGKPISARPVGVIEQAVKWAKRNKRLAVMGAAVLFTMTTATGVSLGFGLETQKQESIARQKQKDAEDAATRVDEEVGRTQLTLARALLGPIRGDGIDALTEYEIEALWELAELRGKPEPLMMLERATRTPLAVAQYRGRAEFLDHAVVGLDVSRENVVNTFLDARLHDDTLPAGVKTEVALGAVRAERMGAADAITATLLAALNRTTGADSSARRPLVEALAIVCVRLPADRGTAVMLDLLTAEPGAYLRTALARGIDAAAGQLPPAEAQEARAKAAEHLLAKLLTELDVENCRGLVKGFVAVARHLPADKRGELCVRAWDAVFAAQYATKDASPRLWLVKCLGILAWYMPSAQYAAAHQQVADLVAEIAIRTDEDKDYGIRAWGELLRLLPKNWADWPDDRLCREVLDVFGRLQSDDRAAAVELLAGRMSGLHDAEWFLHHHRDEITSLAGVPILHPDVFPQPHPLPPQQLVELLKHPFCVREARRAVLDALEFTYDRKFADLWEFVAFAEKEHPELDLLTPPKRPTK